MSIGEMMHHTIVEDIELKEPEVIYSHDRKILEAACKLSKNTCDEANKPQVAAKDPV